MLLGIQSNDEGRDIDYLSSDPNVSLSDQDSCMMDGFCQSMFEDQGLQSSLQEVLHFKSQDVIEFHPVLLQDSDSNQSSKQGISFKQSLGVIVIPSQQFSGSLSNLCQSIFDSPHFSFVFQAKFSDDFQFLIQSFLFIRSSWGRVDLSRVFGYSVVNHDAKCGRGSMTTTSGVDVQPIKDTS